MSKTSNLKYQESYVLFIDNVSFALGTAITPWIIESPEDARLAQIDF